MVGTLNEPIGDALNVWALSIDGPLVPVFRARTAVRDIHIWCDANYDPGTRLITTLLSTLAHIQGLNLGADAEPVHGEEDDEKSPGWSWSWGSVHHGDAPCDGAFFGDLMWGDVTERPGGSLTLGEPLADVLYVTACVGEVTHIQELARAARPPWRVVDSTVRMLLAGTPGISMTALSNDSLTGVERCETLPGLVERLALKHFNRAVN